MSGDNLSSTSTTPNRQYCFDQELFASETFDPATFLAAEQQLHSLTTLRDHLRAYQNDLKNELYNVINRDLADYLHLSSKLSGVDTQVYEIREPLSDLAGSLDEVSNLMETATQSLTDKLIEKQVLRSRQASLQRSIRFLTTIQGVEALLGLRSSTSSSEAAAMPHQPVALKSMAESTSPEEFTERCATLERAAHSWVSLSADLSSGEDTPAALRAMNVPLVRVEKALLGHLTTAFRATVCPKNLVISTGSREEDNPEGITINETALRHCLRCFVALGKGEEAERQLARLLMLPFIDLNFTQGRLDGGSRGSCSGLKAIYSACLTHINRNLSRTLAVAEETLALLPGPGGRPHLDLVCSGVWKPIQHALSTRLSSIFATGIASILHANYTLSMDFLASLASVCGPAYTDTIQTRLQSHPSMKDFRGKWNLPVYFHLRFTEISTRVDAALDKARKSMAPTPTSPERASTKTSPKSSAQVLTTAGLSEEYRAISQSKSNSTITSPLMAKGRLDNLVASCWDTQTFCTLALQDLVAIITQAINTQDPSVVKLARESVEESLQPYQSLITQGWDVVISNLVQQAAATLQAVRGITATYRMTNKSPPQRPSSFVPHILAPIKDFETLVQDRTPPSLLHVWQARVATAIAEKYHAGVLELLASVEQMEDALKKRKQRSKGLGSSMSSGVVQGLAGSGGLSDSDKIKLQLLLDVIAFGKDLQDTSDLDAGDCEPFMNLLRAVSPAVQFITQAGLDITFDDHTTSLLNRVLPPST